MPRSAIAWFFAVVLIASPAWSADDATAKNEIRAAIDGLIAAFETDDADRIRSLMTPDHVAVSPNYARAYSVDDQIGTLGDLDYRVVKVGALDIDIIDPDVALVSQELTVEGSFRGSPLPSEIYVTQVWIRRDGRWLQRLYQETDIAGR